MSLASKLFRFVNKFQPICKTIEVEMDGAVATLVQDLIAKNDVVIFSKTYCPYCNMAKEVFDKVQYDYKTIELDNREDGNVIQAYLGQLTGAKSVPRVFVKGQCVGGGTDVKKLLDNGELVKILQA